MLALPIPSERLLEGLEQHRQLTTRQLYAIYAPESSVQSVRRHLRLLLGRGLVRFSDVGSPHHRAWYLSSLGARVIDSRHPALSEVQAASPLLWHTWGVNEIGLAFLRAARELGHGFEPEDWQHEVWHPLTEKGRGKLKADALLEYRLGRGWISSFVEFDNHNKWPAARIRDQLVAYARFRAGDHWRRFYRAFPSVLVVLTGKQRGPLEMRLQMTLLQVAQHPELRAEMAKGLTLSFCLLEDLQREGPFAPIWRRPGRAEAVNWRGEAESLRIMA